MYCHKLKPNEAVRIGDHITVKPHARGLQVRAPRGIELSGQFGSCLSTGLVVIVPVNVNETLEIGGEVSLVRKFESFWINAPRSLKISSLRKPTPARKDREVDLVA